MATTRVLISMPDGLLEMVDDKANNTGKTRSEFVRDALRFFIQKGEHLTTSKGGLEDAE